MHAHLNPLSTEIILKDSIYSSEKYFSSNSSPDLNKQISSLETKGGRVVDKCIHIQSNDDGESSEDIILARVGIYLFKIS